MRKLILAALATATVLAVPATASASSNTIDLPREYQKSFPAVERVKATNVPRLTDGYAPRWLVAQGLVGVIQYRMSEGKGIPSRVWVRGARWNGGYWRVRYRVVTNGDWSYGRFTATHGSQTLQFNGYS